MSFPVTYKKRKKLRGARNKKEADKYRKYLLSEQCKIDFYNGIKECIKKMKDENN